MVYFNFFFFFDTLDSKFHSASSIKEKKKKKIRRWIVIKCKVYTPHYDKIKLFIGFMHLILRKRKCIYIFVIVII